MEIKKLEKSTITNIQNKISSKGNKMLVIDFKLDNEISGLLNSKTNQYTNNCSKITMYFVKDNQISNKLLKNLLDETNSINETELINKKVIGLVVNQKNSEEYVKFVKFYKCKQ